MTTSVETRLTGWVPDDSTFGARLALIRQRMEWGNVKEAAEACGIAVESWRRWERDGRAPRNVVELAGKIADQTGCDFGWLLAGRRLQGATSSVTGKYPRLPERLTQFADRLTERAQRPADNRPKSRPRAAALAGLRRTALLPRAAAPIAA